MVSTLPPEQRPNIHTLLLCIRLFLLRFEYFSTQIYPIMCDLTHTHTHAYYNKLYRAYKFFNTSIITLLYNISFGFLCVRHALVQFSIHKEYKKKWFS